MAVCVCLLIFFFILFAHSSCSGTSSPKTSIFLGFFLYCCTFVALCRSFCPCICMCVCVCLPAASFAYLNFTRAYTGKDKRDLYPLMPVICSIKLLYAADTLRTDLLAPLPLHPLPSVPLPIPFVIAFLSFLLPQPKFSVGMLWLHNDLWPYPLPRLNTTPRGIFPFFILFLVGLSVCKRVSACVCAKQTFAWPLVVKPFRPHSIRCKQAQIEILYNYSKSP